MSDNSVGSWLHIHGTFLPEMRSKDDEGEE